MADHKDVNTGDLLAVGAWIIIPVIGLVYVRIESAILRRAGVPPIEEPTSLKFPEQKGDAPAGLRKAA